MRRLHAVSILVLVHGVSAPPVVAQRAHAGVAAGYLAYGTYFEGPGEIRFSNRDGPTVGLSGDWSFRPILSLAVAASLARSDWTFREVPLVGEVNIGGARLWFADASLRLLPLGARGGTPRRTPGALLRDVQPFVQVGGGFVHYSVHNSVLDEHATNVALILGGGFTVALGRVRAELLVKDWISSFAGVDAGVVGATGRRAHTIGIMAGLSLGL